MTLNKERAKENEEVEEKNKKKDRFGEREKGKREKGV